MNALERQEMVSHTSQVEFINVLKKLPLFKRIFLNLLLAFDFRAWDPFSGAFSKAQNISIVKMTLISGSR